MSVNYDGVFSSLGIQIKCKHKWEKREKSYYSIFWRSKTAKAWFASVWFSRSSSNNLHVYKRACACIIFMFYGATLLHSAKTFQPYFHNSIYTRAETFHYFQERQTGAENWQIIFSVVISLPEGYTLMMMRHRQMWKTLINMPKS